MVDTHLAEPHGSMLAFLSDLHEQVEMQINQCTDDTLRRRSRLAKLCRHGALGGQHGHALSRNDARPSALERHRL